MDLKTAKKKLFHIAQLYEEMSRLVRQLDECMEFQSGNEFVDNILSGCNWEARKIHYGCRAEKDALYSSDGELLSKSSGSLSNPTSYYVNQSVGYVEDDYYGDMFIATDDKGTYVEVFYEC